MSSRLDQHSTSAGHTDEQPNYDHTSNDVKRPALVSDLRERVDDDVRFDTCTWQLCATDASTYEETPIGVIFPTSTEDTAAVVPYCSEWGTPVLPWGAGTSLAGQAVNEAAVLDLTRYMGIAMSVDADTRYAQVQSGVVLVEPNGALSPHELKFAPDPTTGDRSIIGGAIGNNSTGVHSLKYGKTDAYAEECEVALADGMVVTLGEMDLDKLRERADSDGTLLQRVYAKVVRIVDDEADEVRVRFSELKRNASGYNLDVLVEEAKTGTVNLVWFMAGSEGILVVVTEVKVVLEPVPETKAVSLLFYESILDVATDVQHTLGHDPAAVELIDDVLIGLARDTADSGEIAALVPDDIHVGLLMESYANDDGHERSLTLGFLTDCVPEGEGDAEPPRDHPDTV